MKRAVVCLCILAAMTAAGIWVTVSTERTTAHLRRELEQLEQLSYTLPEDELESGALALKDEWESFCEWNIFLTNNECAFEITQALARIASKVRSDRDDVPEECRFASLLVENYYRSRRLTPENII